MNFLKPLALAVALSTATMVAAPLGGCGTTSQASAHLNTARGLYIAELSYNAFATSIVGAAHSGVLTGDKLTQAKAAEAKAYAALQLARQGRGSADAVIDALGDAKDLVPVTPAP